MTTQWSPVLSAVSELYRLKPENFLFLAQSQNIVFEFKWEGQARVLRFTPDNHRSFDQVEAEMEWLSCLSAAGVHISTPCPAENGRIANSVETEGGSFTVAAFLKAPGEIGQKKHWTSDTFRTWGSVMGRMHRAAANFSPLHRRRHDWTASLPSDTSNTEDEIEAQLRLRDLTVQLRRLPQSQSSYGLIHADLHFWNFSVHSNGITVFDFDNSEYHWFLADLGTVVFEACTCIYQQIPRQTFIREFLGEFLAGYQQENDFGDALRELPLFVKLREVQIFLILSQRWKRRELGPFQQRFFSEMRQSILEDRPFVEDTTMSQVVDLASRKLL